MAINPTYVSLAKTYLRRMYTAMNRSYTFDQFLAGLKLNSYNEAISEADFNEWLSDLGFIVTESQKGFFSNPHEDLIEAMAGGSYAANPAWVPTRKTIDSYWLSYDFKPSYYDIAKIALTETTKVVNSVGNVVGTVGNVLNETGQVAANTMKTLKYVAFIGGPLLIGYIVYKNKDKIADKVGRATGKLMDSTGEGIKKLGAAGLKKIKERK